MNKNKILSWLMILLAVIVSVGSIFVLISYATDILKAVVDFITQNDLKKLASCGAVFPSQFDTIKNDFTALLLPALYYGTPLLLLLVSLLMFCAGYFYSKGKSEDESKKREDIERDMVRKATERLVRQKAKEAEDSASKAMEEELETPAQATETKEETPTDMIVRKKRK